MEQDNCRGRRYLSYLLRLPRQLDPASGNKFFGPITTCSPLEINIRNQLTVRIQYGRGLKLSLVV